MVNQFMRSVMQPKIWRFVCFVSSVIGMLCYALSSSFNNLFGKWNFLKVFLYSLFSFIICLAILFANTCHSSNTSRRLKAHLVFSVFTITTVYSFFFDKANGKPDLYSLVSCAAFAIMSLSLSKQTHLGFEIDLLYFFCGYLTLQLMKIKLFLVFVGVIFSYSLIILRFHLGNPTESGHLGLGLQINDPHSVLIQIHENSSETNYRRDQVDFSQTSNAAEDVHLIMPQEAINSESATIRTFSALQENMDLGLVAQVSLSLTSQQGNRDSDSIKLESFKKDVVQLNENLNSVIWQQFMMIRQQVFPDSYITDNTFKIKEMKDINEDLHKLVKNMVEAGFHIECCNMYNIFRMEFLNKCLCTLGLQDLNLYSIENEMNGSLINALNTVLRILLPNERIIWHRVFSGFSPKYSIFSSLEWKRMETELWAKFIELETHIHYNSPQEAFLGCGVHPHTRGLMKCIKDVSEDRNNTTHFHIPSIIQLLSNLDMKSKNYKNLALRNLFMLNNNRYIQLMAKYDPLQTILGEDWIQIQTSKVRRNIRNYLKSSWNKLVKLMKTNESMTPNAAIKSIRMFHLHFYDICVAQSASFVVDEWLREAMRRSVRRMFLPLYEDFVRRIKDVLGKEDDDRYIKYNVSDIDVQLDCLFRGNYPIKPPPSIPDYSSS